MSSFLLLPAPNSIYCDFAELFEGGFEVFDDLLREDIGVGEIVGLFEVFVVSQNMRGLTSPQF